MQLFRDITIPLDTAQDYVPHVVDELFIKQSDVKGRTLTVKLTNAGKPVDDKVNLVLTWRNKEHYGSANFTKKGSGEYSVEVPPEMCTHKGNVACAIQITPPDRSWLIESRSFNVFCEGSPVSPQMAYESETFTAYLEAASKVEGNVAQAAQVVKDFETKSQAALTSKLNDIDAKYSAKTSELERGFTNKQSQLEQSFTTKQNQLEQGFNTKLSEWEKVSAANDKAAKEKQSQLDQIIKNYQSASPLTKGAADGFYQAKGDYATKAGVQAEIKKLIGTAPAELDTLGELATKLKETGDAASSLVVGLSSKAERAELAQYVKTADLNSRLTSYPTTQELSTKLTGYQVKGDYLTSSSASSTYATKTNLSTEITNLKGGASSSYDTLKKIETMITALKSQVEKTPYIVDNVNTYESGYPTGKRAYVKWSDGRLEQWGWWNIASSQISAGQAHGKLDLAFPIPFVQGDYPIINLTCECLDNDAVVQPSIITATNAMFSCTYTANKGISSNKTVCIYYHAIGFWK